jgi:hypothetical protein
MISYKNKLQEFCQRLKIELPTYSTNMGDNGLFECSVHIIHNNNRYCASGNDRKKIQAEQKAAEALCMILNSYIRNGAIRLDAPPNTVASGDPDANTISSGFVRGYSSPPNTEHLFAHRDPNTNKGIVRGYSSSSNIRPPIPINIKAGEYVLVMVDLENITNGLEEMFKKYEFKPANMVHFMGFLSFGHHNAKKEYSFLSPTGYEYKFEISKIDSTRRDACDVALVMRASQIIPFYKPNIVVVASGDKFAPALVDAINTNFLGNANNTRAIHANNADEIGFRLM